MGEMRRLIYFLFLFAVVYSCPLSFFFFLLIIIAFIRFFLHVLSFLSFFSLFVGRVSIALGM